MKGVLRALFLSKVKFVAAVVLVGIAATLGTLVWARPDPDSPPTAPRPAPAPKDQERIVGSWTIVSLEAEGKKAPEEMFRGGRWTFAADGLVTSNLRAPVGRPRAGRLSATPKGPS
jgi:hypothetical protein